MKSLRLGSIVSQGTVKSFYEHGIHVGFGKCIQFNEVKPEPITEVWLQKFGFESTKNMVYIGDFVWKLKFAIGEVHFLATGARDFHETGHMVVETRSGGNPIAYAVGYVHEMQNIFHALSYGKEMELIEIVPEEPEEYRDIKGKLLTNGDLIDIHQTVNGQNRFIVLETQPLDIRYGHDANRKYEYSKEELLALDSHTGESEFEIIGNIYNMALLGRKL